MPANLNALIRYKTINSCLHGGRRKWSIDELMAACSSALAESRGRYDTVSERTIRDDIRVMRSDILGFNAPIEQKRGLYFYADPYYSIMTISISDAGLAMQIISLLQELRNEVKHPELETILERLKEMTGKMEIPKKSKTRMKAFKESASYEDSIPHVEAIPNIITDVRELDTKFSFQDPKLMIWGEIMGLIN
jgi:hypothetical protein